MWVGGGVTRETVYVSVILSSARVCKSMTVRVYVCVCVRAGAIMSSIWPSSCVHKCFTIIIGLFRSIPFLHYEPQQRARNKFAGVK